MTQGTIGNTGARVIPSAITAGKKEFFKKLVFTLKKGI